VRVCLGAALGLRFFINRTIGDALPFVTVFGATAAAQWYGGRPAAGRVARSRRNRADVERVA
jgi:hypothetical protein